jgi:parallel beta-helix repeat protein
MKTIFKAIGILLAAVILFAAGYIISNKRKSDVPPPPTVNYFSGAGNKNISGLQNAEQRNVIEVKSGQLIQEAVNKAKSGDLIRVYPGTYKETVYIDKDNIYLQGVVREGEWPILEGEKTRNDAILYSGNNMVIENFKIMNYKGNGIMGQAGNNFIIRNNYIIDTGVYGIFPEFGTNGLVSHNILSGIEDAAIYVGMCDNIDVLYNEVFKSVAGIEIENSRHALVEGNYVHDNTGGILAFITPGLPIKTCFDVIIRNNYVINNNVENFGEPGSIVASLPKGTGIIVMAADEVTIENNIITGNENAGIVMTDLNFIAHITKDPESEPNPDRIVILDNIMSNNGSNPIDELKAYKVANLVTTPGIDIVAIGGGTGSCIRDKGRYLTVGLGNYAQCTSTGTASVLSYMLAEPAPPRDTKTGDRGRLIYYGICSGCHSYNMRMIGPPVMAIQALYKDNPQGIADYIANPVHKRQDFPEMPPQDYLSEEKRLEVAKYMLSIDK